MNSTDFYFNGQKSTDLGIYLVSVESGMKETPFLADKQIVSEKIIGNDIPYVYSVERSTLTLDLTFSCLEGLWTFEKRRELARWIDTSTFEEFYSVDDVHKKYYIQYIDGIDLTHNGNQQGYIVCRFQNISPYSYSPIYTKSYDLSGISSPTIIEFKSNGDNPLKPELWITKIGAGDLSIKNISDGGKEFTFTGLNDQELVYVDNKNRHIETDVIGIYRFDDFNGEYLELPRGVNRLEVSSPCKLDFRFQYEIKG